MSKIYTKQRLLEMFSREDYTEVILQLLDKYVGGRPFFNALDDYIKTHENMMLAIVDGMENENIASSGTFGDNLFELYEQGKFKCKSIVIFNGKICTKNKGVTCWYPHDVDLDNKEWVFVDDSTFSGRTIKVIGDHLREDHNSRIKSISVAYDGSKTKNPNIKSFYRYYDHHSLNESLEFNWMDDVVPWDYSDSYKLWFGHGSIDLKEEILEILYSLGYQWVVSTGEGWVKDFGLQDSAIPEGGLAPLCGVILTKEKTLHYFYCSEHNDFKKLYNKEITPKDLQNRVNINENHDFDWID